MKCYARSALFFPRTLNGLLILMLGLAMGSCSATSKITDADVTVVDYVGLRKLMEEEQGGLVLVDARPSFRYRLGHLPGALNIPLPELKPTDPRLAEAEYVVVYGGSARNALSHAAAKKVLVGRLAVVLDFRGGFEMWEKNGGPVVTGSEPGTR